MATEDVRLEVRHPDGSLIRGVNSWGDPKWAVEHAAMWKQRYPDAVVTYKDLATGKPWTPPR
jgi:hypothetical protein